MRAPRGFTLVEVMISMAVLSMTMATIGSMLIQSSRLNRSQQLKSEVQTNARNCLSMVVARLRSAGWDPLNAGIPIVTLDPDAIDADHADGVDNIEIFADFNADGETDGTATNDDDREQTLVRHNWNRVEWRPEPGAAFVALAVNITNDADSDGISEPMFVPDDPVNPARMTVQVTAESPVPDPVTRGRIRYTVSSNVVLRKSL